MPLESIEEGFNRWRDRALEAELENERLKAEIEALRQPATPVDVITPADLVTALRNAGTERDKIEARRTQHDRASVLREAIDVAREEGHRLEAEAGIEAARGARSVAYLLRKLLVKAQPAEPAATQHRVVAYRSALPGALSIYCTRHTDQLGTGVTPLTTDDLPDGGMCALCDRDVLIPQEAQ